MSEATFPLNGLAKLPERTSVRTKPIVEQSVVIAPGPTSGGEGCAALLGGAIALTSLFNFVGAHDAAARLELITCADLSLRISSFIGRDELSLFDGEFVRLHPYWLAVAVTILEHVTIGEAEPQPTAIGGFALSAVLPGAIQLASVSGPFERVVPHLKCIAIGVMGDEC